MPASKEPTLAQKLASVLIEVNNIKMSGKNAHHGYDYLTESDLTNAIRPLLGKQGVFIFPSVESLEWNGKIATVWLKWTISDGNESMEIMGVGQGSNNDKAVYSAITGAQKYLLYKTFLVSTGDDPEAFEHADTSQQGKGRSTPRTRKINALRQEGDLAGADLLAARANGTQAQIVIPTELATQEQRGFLTKMLKSSVFTEDERLAFSAKLEKNPTKANASDLISRVKTELEKRKSESAKGVPVEEDLFV